MSDSTIRKITVKALTRVEGEGSLRVRVVGERVEIAEFSIYEPPRFFEKLVQGRAIRELPDIVARICGICPVAYQMSACGALEQALGIVTTPGIEALRRVLYCGEWIQSHALHIHLLHAPDFLGHESGLSLAKVAPELVERGLRLKALGNRIMEVVGGRAVHPINVTVGGFYKPPDSAALRGLLPELEWGLAAAEEVVRETSRFEFPDFTREYECVCLKAEGEYPMNHGRVVSTGGLDIDVADYERHFQERQVSWSTALQSVMLPEEKPYLCGPIARLNLCFEQLPPRARAAARSTLSTPMPERTITRARCIAATTSAFTGANCVITASASATAVASAATSFVCAATSVAPAWPTMASSMARSGKAWSVTTTRMARNSWENVSPSSPLK